MSTQPVTLDLSKAQPLPRTSAAPITLDMSKATPLPGQKPTVSPWEAEQEQAHQTRMSALAGLTGMPTPNMSEQDKESFQQGKAAGAISVPLVAGGTALGASGLALPVAKALMPIARRYGIRALEGAGLGAGYDLYKELKRVFEGQ